MNKILLVSILLLILIGSVHAGSTPPTTTFSYEQIPNTTDTNITLSCTDNNSGCKSINYNINNEGWNVIYEVLTGQINDKAANEFSGSYSSNANDFTTVKTYNLNSYGSGKTLGGFDHKLITATSTTVYARLKYNYSDATSDFSNTTTHNTNSWSAIKQFTALSNPLKNLDSIELQLYTSNSNNGTIQFWFDNYELDYNYGSAVVPIGSFIYSSAGDHNIQFYSTDNANNNEATKTSTFSTSGLLRLNFFDDTTKTSLNQVYLEFNGTPYYSDSNSFIYIDLNGLTSGSKTILLQRTGYQEKSFSLNLNQYSDLNYNIGFIESSNISEVDFQVFTETGALKPNTSFTATDNDNNYLIDIKTTDSQGRVTFYLNNQKSDYNFVSTDLNFGTTLWTINKPKDASTLVDIVGNWKYSITGNSYSSGTNIVANVQKILLQNTVNPYYIKIQDVNENYAESSFGLKSITSEKTKTLNPFIYPFGSAELKLIKLLDFSTNQPISTFNELLLSLYTDSNGLIEIGTYINDSTGTYNIYMDSNAQYKLVIDEQTFILKPTLSVYYLYLTTPSGLHIDTNTPLVDNNWVDLNSPTIILEVRQFFFGCPIEEDNCYPSMVFALIAIVILSIGLVGLMRLGPLEQSVINIILLSVFTFIGFIPLWLFGITLVIILAWGVFA